MKTDFQNLQSFLQTMSNLQSLAEEGVEINLEADEKRTYSDFLCAFYDVDSLNDFIEEEIKILKENNIHNADKLKPKK